MSAPEDRLYKTGAPLGVTLNAEVIGQGGDMQILCPATAKGVDGKDQQAGETGK
jgi:hypothetical protein